MSHIDESILGAINANEKAVIEKYGFEVRDENGHFALLDKVVRKASRGKGGRHVGGNLELLLRAAVSERKAHDDNAGAPSDKPKTKVAGNGNVPETDTKPKTPAAPKLGAPDGVPAASSDPTDDQRTTISRYGFTAEPAKGNTWEIIDPVVAKYYAFRDASKKGKYVGELAVALGQAIEVRSQYEAEIAAPKNGKGKKTRATLDNGADKPAAKGKKEKPAKAPKERKDNRYLRAFRVIAAKPDVTAELLAKQADMSVSMAGNCLVAWASAMQVQEEHKSK